MLALNPDSLTAIWAIPATDTSIKILVGALLDPEDVRHGSHHGLPDRGIHAYLHVWGYLVFNLLTP